MSAPAMTSRFAPISLQELNQQARIMTRIDRKYCLSRKQAQTVLDCLGEETKVLTIGGTGLLSYHTVYFDTEGHNCYLRAATHRRVRAKIRQRLYVDTDTAFVEIKHAGPRRQTIKHRRACLVAEVENAQLAPEHQAWVEEETSLVDLSPQLWNTYRRSTLLLPDSNPARATIDTDLTWYDRTPGNLVHEPDLVIVETKTAHGASSLDRALWCHGHRPVRLSKFGAGMALLNPELPHNRWSRSIHRYHTPQTI